MPPAVRNRPGAFAQNFAIPEREAVVDAFQKGLVVGFAGGAERRVGYGKADLRHASAGHDPAEITGRPLRIDKAVEEIRIDGWRFLIFRFQADQEFAVAAEAEDFRHARARAIRAE